MNKLNDSFQFILLDHCFSDYFSGHHLPVISVPTYESMTYRDVLEGIEEELNLCCDMYEGYSEEMIKEAKETFFQAIKDQNLNIDDIFVEITEEYEEECPYLYFVLGKIEYKMGFNYAVNENF